MRDSGGTSGGIGTFLAGLSLSLCGVYLLLDSTRMISGHGWMAGVGRGWGLGNTASGIIVWVPFLIAIMWLFFNAAVKTAWWLFWIGLSVVVLDILSGFRFYSSIKTTHFIIILVMIAGGIGLILRSFKES